MKLLPQCLPWIYQCCQLFLQEGQYPQSSSEARKSDCVDVKRLIKYGHYTNRLNKTYKSPFLPTNNATKTAAHLDRGNLREDSFDFGSRYVASRRRHLGKYVGRVPIRRLFS